MYHKETTGPGRQENCRKARKALHVFGATLHGEIFLKNFLCPFFGYFFLVEKVFLGGKKFLVTKDFSCTEQLLNPSCRSIGRSFGRSE